MELIIMEQVVTTDTDLDEDTPATTALLLLLSYWRNMMNMTMIMSLNKSRDSLNNRDEASSLEPLVSLWVFSAVPPALMETITSSECCVVVDL